MNGFLGLNGMDVALAVAALAAGAAWLLGAAVVYVVRRPPEPPVGTRTLDLGPEPPAVANFLVHDFRVTGEAVPATLIDLAARNVVDLEERGPGVFFIRLRATSDVVLTAYERRIVAHLRTKASDGVVPAEALTTGPDEESKRWRRAFTGEVVADAKARGLSRDALGGRVFTALTIAALVPAVLLWAVSTVQAGAVVIIAAVALLGWIRARHPQRETAEGLAAASRWLGVRAELAENEAFATHSPITVELWDRLLAYGAALGVASGAIGPLPMGAESDTHAWSAYGGRWRPVRIAYPRLWPIGWGLHPLLALVGGGAAAVGGALALYFIGPSLLDFLESSWVGVIPGVLLLVPSLAVVLGVALVVMALADLRATVEITGPIVRLRSFGDEDDRRYFVAVDDGSSREIRAWRVSAAQYTGLEQGQLVTASVTKNLGCVRSILRAHATEGA